VVKSGGLVYPLAITAEGNGRMKHLIEGLCHYVHFMNFLSKMAYSGAKGNIAGIPQGITWIKW